MKSRELPASCNPSALQRFFGSLNPIQLIRNHGAIARAQIDEDTATALFQKNADRTLAMADRKVQADVRIQDRECTLFEDNEMLRLEAQAYFQRKADYEAFLERIGGDLHPLDGNEDMAEMKRIYSKNGNGRKK
jgi:hypothetical protein